MYEQLWTGQKIIYNEYTITYYLGGYLTLSFFEKMLHYY